MSGAARRATRLGLPGGIVAVLYVAVLLLPLGLAVLTGIDPAGPWGEAGAATGMVAAVALMLQFVTSGRFETLAGGVGIDVTMAFHKWTARMLVLAVILHPLLYLAPTFLDDPQLGLTRLWATLAAPRYRTGVIALVLVVAIVIAAINRDRIRVPYEVWRGAHWLGAFVAAALTTMHTLRAGTYSDALPLQPFWPVLAALVVVSAVIVYGVRWAHLSRQRWEIAANRRLADDLHELTLRPLGAHRLAFPAGQFVWLATAPRLFPLFDHPFSIASSPLGGPDLRLIVKEAGDYTGRIGALAPGTRAGVDGPHGSFVLDDLDADAILLVAGGIGIAPVLSLLDDLASKGDRRPVRLVYRGTKPSRMVAPQEIAARAGSLDFTAICSAREAGPDWAHETARPDAAMYERAMAGLDRGRVAAMICGPGPMITAASDTLAGLGLPPSLIRYERFDYMDESRSARDRATMLRFYLMGAAVIAAMAVFAFR